MEAAEQQIFVAKSQGSQHPDHRRQRISPRDVTQTFPTLPVTMLEM